MSAPVVNVVIGAGSGMGAAVAARLAGRGPLLLADLRVDALGPLASHLGPHVTTAGCDVSDQSSVEALAALVPSLGALVITVGLSPTMARGRRIYEVNLLGTTRVLLAFDSAVGAGSAAVLFASTAGHMMPAVEAIDATLDDAMADDFFARLSATGVDIEVPEIAYSISKRGVLRIPPRLAASWGARGARIVSVSPGIIDTPMGKTELAHQPLMAPMIEATPLARQGLADEVAAVAAFLCSADASFVSGCDVLVDGGYIGATAAASA